MAERQRNDGLRKRCGCPRRRWGECSHPWHVNYKWKGKHYRLNLDREANRKIRLKSDARIEFERIRSEIRAGTFRTSSTEQAHGELTFSQFAKLWHEGNGQYLVRARDNGYRLALIEAFVLPGTEPPLTFGQKHAAAIAVGDVEAYRAARKDQHLSTVTINHDLKLLRKMFNWGIRFGYLEQTPFKRGPVTTISLEREIPRNKRFHSEEDEERLLRAATPQLHALIVGMLETACRPGELLSLQWGDVNLERGELTIRAAKSKTRTERVLPISARLRAVLEMRQRDPAGEQFGPEAYVFGNEVGRQTPGVRNEWEKVRAAAGLEDFHLADLRHEAASRFEEFGVPTLYVSQFLGHSNLTTTTRYLNSTRRGLHWAMERFEEAREERAKHAEAARKKAARAKRRRTKEQSPAVAQTLHTATKRPSQPSGEPTQASQPKSFVS
jgi:integrase